MKKVILFASVFALVACQNKKEVVEEVVVETPEAVAEAVTYQYNPETTKLTWTAYKTPEKVGVSGTFTEIEVSNTKESAVKEEVLEGASFKINGLSVSSGDESRDAKLADFFFQNLAAPEITGSIGKFGDKIVPITIVLNDVEIVKDFGFSFENNKLTLTGTIDILDDFKAKKSFDLLHDACKDLHLNKTWSDVSIEIITEL